MSSPRVLSLSVISHGFGAVDKTSSSFSAHSKIGIYIIIIIIMTSYMLFIVFSKDIRDVKTFSATKLVPSL